MIGGMVWYGMGTVELFFDVSFVIPFLESFVHFLLFLFVLFYRL